MTAHPGSGDGTGDGSHAHEALQLLEHAPLWQVAATGLALGVVHIVTGPDHLSALVALANGQSWRRAFALGVQWGAGHAVGIVAVAVAGLALGRALALDGALRDALNYLIGVFLVLLGGWTLYHAHVEWERQQKPPSKWASVQCQDATYFALLADEDQENPAQLKAAALLTSHAPEAVSQVQRSASVGVGLVHGIAGPGGVLGVLPVVALHSSLARAAVYLACFCGSSIVAMGAFAALYGEVTSRGGGQSALATFRVAAASSGVSIAVGIVWIVLQACGQLDKVFGHHH